MTAFSAIEFNWPWILWALPLPLCIVFVKNWFRQKAASNAIRITPGLAGAFQQLKNSKVSNSRRSAVFFRLLLLSIAWLCLLIAIAQPSRPESTQALTASGRAMAVLIDLSTSMERRDFTIDGEPVDRLSVVKKIASEFIAERAGDRIGLVLFGSEAFIASPLTYDLNAVNHVLQSSGIGMAGRTTAMGDALGLAIRALRDDPAEQKAIVLLSDGTNNAGSAEPEDAALLAKELGIRVHAIGLGSDGSTSDQQQFQSASADLDEATLKSIAQASGGQFFRASSTDQLQMIYHEIDSLESTDYIAPPLIIKSDLRNIFICITLLCFLLFTLPAISWKTL